MIKQHAEPVVGWPMTTQTNRPQKVKPVLRWPGGKTRLLKHLLPLIPPHECYCEPFAGGLALLLAKERSPVEVVNDLNGDLVALYRCIQYHLPELLRELSFLISSRQILKEFINQPGVTDIQRAARFYFRSRTSFGGTMRSFGVARTRGGAGSGFNRIVNEELLGPARERLQGVMIENLPYGRCMELYDSPNSFLFLDPPYLNATPDAYDGWTEKQLQEFRDRVAKLKGKWVVTLDDSEFNRGLFDGCRIQSFESRNGVVNVGKHPGARFKEIVVQP
jgi:DNA adenine methylase